MLSISKEYVLIFVPHSDYYIQYGIQRNVSKPVSKPWNNKL